MRIHHAVACCSVLGCLIVVLWGLASDCLPKLFRQSRILLLQICKLSFAQARYKRCCKIEEESPVIRCGGGQTHIISLSRCRKRCLRRCIPINGACTIAKGRGHDNLSVRCTPVVGYLVVGSIVGETFQTWSLVQVR